MGRSAVARPYHLQLNCYQLVSEKASVSIYALAYASHKLGICGLGATVALARSRDRQGIIPLLPDLGHASHRSREENCDQMRD